MKKAFFLILALTVSASAVWYFLQNGDLTVEHAAPINLHSYLAETDEMVAQGKYAAALERHIWFYDNALDHDPNMAGVRSSFALCGWKRLADLYPPAMEALVQTRDREAKLARNGAGNWDLFSDIRALNRTLGDPDRTAELFVYLHDNQPEIAESLWPVATSDVIAAGMYDLASQYIGDPMQTLAANRRSFERERTFDGDEEMAAFYREHRERSFVERTVELMTVYGGLGRYDVVDQIGKEALEIFRDPQIEEAMARADTGYAN